MRTSGLVVAIAGRWRALAPVVATTATAYGLYGAFQKLDTSPATWGTALAGILRSAAATVVLLLLSLSVAVLFGLVNGRRDDNGAS